MCNYTDVNRTPFTDADIEEWASDAESERGYTGKHLGPSVPGPPAAWERKRVRSPSGSVVPAGPS
jgi:hypothetical protein